MKISETNMDYNILSKKYKSFVYKSYEISYPSADKLKITFLFKLEPDIIFQPSVTIPFNTSIPLSSKVINNLAFHLGLAEIPSYWKTACPPHIIIEAGHLNDAQIKFWETVFIKGLGEFFYQNQIDFTKPNFIKITSTPHNGSARERYDGVASERVLVPLGGGKDSIVTLEILKKEELEFNALLLNPTKAARAVAEIGCCTKPIVIKRTLDPLLLELNSKGYLNGHTPFSAYLAFVCVFAAILNDYKHIALSNEQSASDGNLFYHEMVINHQWSKSFEFEKMFQAYCKEFLSAEHHYFSNLRTYDELYIAEQFSKHPQYFAHFRSCNRGSKENKWCNECPKCLFVFTILYPFIPDKEMLDIFGENLLENKNLEKLFEQLVGISENKPFDCVGTAKEMRHAIMLGLAKTKKPPFLLKKVQNKFDV